MRDTRAILLAEAEQLVRTRGYAAFSYADLADRVGIRKASIHHHFPSKIDLATALLASYDQRYDQGMAEILDASQDGMARLAAYADLYCRGVQQSLGCLCAAFSVELETLPGDLREALGRFFAKHMRWVEHVLEAGIANKTINDRIDAPGFARLIFSSLEGSLLIERALDGEAGFNRLTIVLRELLKPMPTLS